MDQHCHSCTAPLSGDFKGPSEFYCKYCADEQGNLKSRDDIHEGIMHWFMGWQPNITPEIARKRADLFMSALPAWADE